MKKTISRLAVAGLLSLAPISAKAQYTQMQWGINKTVSPYNVAVNIGGSWYNFATVNSAGAWNIPSSSVSGLGTAAGQNIGTSGGNVPLLNGVNTWSGTQTFSTVDATGSNILSVAAGSSPYNFGANIGGTWRNLGTVSSAGVWQIPASNLTGTMPVANGGTGTSTAFTSGSVVFAGASGVYSQNNSKLFWDNTNIIMGIGTNSPATYGPNITTIDVEGSSGGGIKFGSGTAKFGAYYSSGVGLLQTFDASPIIFATNNAQRASIAADGSAFTLQSPIVIPTGNCNWTTMTGGLIPNCSGGRITKAYDRLFLGAASVNSGDFAWGGPWGSTTKDYIDTYESTRSHVSGFRTSWATLASLSNTGGIGVLGAARTSDVAIPTFQLGMGVVGYGINDNTTSQQLATGGYFVGARLPGAGTSVGTTGVEVDVVDEGSSPTVTPNNVWPAGFSTALQLNSGGAAHNVGPVTPNSASAALTIGNNQADFWTGIVFGKNAIKGTTGTSGGGSAIRLGNYHQVEWWLNSSSSPYFKIVTQGATPANAQQIVVNDSGMTLGNTTTPGLSIVYTGSTQTSWPYVQGGQSGIPTVIGVDGTANEDLNITAKGTGILRLQKNTFVSGVVVPQSTTIAGLPVCSATLLGAISMISNGTAYGTGTYGSAVSATGAVTRKVLCTNTGGATTYAWAYD